ncbi:hypothetical protein CI610_03395 [invertebrate metagenome]|uniref:Uncharacterized protein n=1 Tax=invertebrate metagenome TaxID=1711999 RepID=A0A2H9T373_9ZZZZ
MVSVLKYTHFCLSVPITRITRRFLVVPLHSKIQIKVHVGHITGKILHTGLLYMHTYTCIYIYIYNKTTQHQCFIYFIKNYIKSLYYI